MSYLLKALEKAEQERQQQSLNDQSPQTVVVQQSSLPNVFIFVAIGVFALVAYSVFKPLDPVSVSEDTPEVETNTQPLAVVSPETKFKQAVVSESFARTDTKTNQANNSNKVAVEKSVSADVATDQSAKVFSESSPLDLVELDAVTLNALPTIRFQSHIYSSAADYRTVMINDRTLKEGMPISATVRLKEITPTGVVIHVNDQLVALPKGQDWIVPQ